MGSSNLNRKERAIVILVKSFIRLDFHAFPGMKILHVSRPGSIGGGFPESGKQECQTPSWFTLALAEITPVVPPPFSVSSTGALVCQAP